MLEILSFETATIHPIQTNSWFKLILSFSVDLSLISSKEIIRIIFFIASLSKIKSCQSLPAWASKSFHNRRGKYSRLENENFKITRLFFNISHSSGIHQIWLWRKSPFSEMSIAFGFRFRSIITLKGYIYMNLERFKNCANFWPANKTVETIWDTNNAKLKKNFSVQSFQVFLLGIELLITGTCGRECLFLKWVWVTHDYYSCHCYGASWKQILDIIIVRQWPKSTMMPVWLGR